MKNRDRCQEIIDELWIIRGLIHDKLQRINYLMKKLEEKKKDDNK